MRTLTWLGIAFVLFVVPEAAIAVTNSQYYDTPGTWPIGISCAGCMGLNVGGVAFYPQRARPQLIEVDDDRSQLVSFTVCQDFDRDGNCGESFEPIVLACGGFADLLTSTVPFRSDFTVNVFLAASGGGSCGVAARGWVTLTSG